MVDYSKYPSSGYLNVTTAPGTDSGWVVRNLPIDHSSGYPGLSTIFNLGNVPGVPVTQISAYVGFSPTPQSSFPGLSLSPYPVGRLPHNAQGIDQMRPAPPAVPVDARVIQFNGGATSLAWQTGHPNIEQETNQCFPASVANSLQWLKLADGTPVPDPHRPGILDNSLVGKLDTSMKRVAHQVPTYRGGHTGKLDYIGNAGLRLFLSVRHKNVPGTAILPNNNVTSSGVTSVVNNNANLSLPDWAISEVQRGSDVELGFAWDNGGAHIVDLIGGGYIAGVPWVAWVHDANQGHVAGVPDPLQTAINGGVSWFDGGVGFSFIVNNRLVAFIGGKFGAATLQYAIAESDTHLGAPDLRSLPGQGYCSLSWPSVSGATAYNIYRSTVTGEETLLTTTGSTQYIDSGVTAGATYYYEADATDGLQISPVSIESSCAPGTLARQQLAPAVVIPAQTPAGVN